MDIRNNFIFLSNIVGAVNLLIIHTIRGNLIMFKSNGTLVRRHFKLK